ncbi:MAG TPA: hypothetical protein PKL09_01155 [bacterium]|mgnify:FL=1|nr:hypothetical protein [bacterium]HNS33837.1 hypothetical protein [bacterium]HNZ73613.1 hypothetical protein [bacterium]HOH67462.1 hypothetical protein [bacterium]HQA63927.1 hypothetical protein [bacterium]
MIQINLNLLSPEHKKELKVKRIYITIKEMVMLILLFTCISAILLLLSRYFLEEQLAMLMDKNATAIRVGEEINKKVVTFNEKITNAYNIQQKSKHWSQLLVTIATITPADIAYNSIKIYPEKTLIELQGTAQTRQALINFKNELDDNDSFSEIDLPLTDLLAKENNSFTLKAKIKLDH